MKPSEETIKREAGFYWVKYEGVWQVASWETSWRNVKEWALAGCELYKENSEMEEIDERRIVRDGD